MKLVIIASDAIIRKALSQYFSSTGLIEATAMPCNASRVLRYFAKRTPDVILLNLDVHTLDIISALDKAKQKFQRYSCWPPNCYQRLPIEIYR